MLCLFLDLSWTKGFFGLFAGGTTLAFEVVDIQAARHPTHIFATMLARHGVSLAEIAYIACGVGPGSYTGSRSACTVAKAVSFSTGKPIVALPSLLLFSPEQGGPFRVVMPAGLGGAFTQRVTFIEGVCTYEHPCLMDQNSLSDAKEELVSAAPLVFDYLQRPILHRSGSSSLVAHLAHQLYVSGNTFSAHNLPVIYLGVSQVDMSQIRPRINEPVR